MKYRTIVADPPWRYANTTGLTTNMKGNRRLPQITSCAEGHYATMDNSELAGLPMGEFADDECSLYLWVTNPLMFGHGKRHRGPVAPIDIVEAWGFRYVTLLTWVKTGPPGMGFHFRGHTEHAIYAVRGDVKIPVEIRESNVIVAPRRGHSEKPDAFMDLVERVSPEPRLEMFARRQRLGWDTWGNECFEHADMAVTP